MWALATVQGCGIYTQYVYVNWLPSYLQAANGISIGLTGVLTAAPFVFSGTMVLGLSRLTDRLLSGDAVPRGGRRILVVLSLAASAAIVFIPLVTTPYAKLAVISFFFFFDSSST